ncbi:hypothetical protein GCM10010448_04350 [Streptomyces glomeratus]|uniref:DUF397 domain-containing protein n=1 Tax=Streptomyces glomeratus TaxID=284452 RepID=A0ABN3YCX3_9ACTN
MRRADVTREEPGARAAQPPLPRPALASVLRHTWGVARRARASWISADPGECTAFSAAWTRPEEAESFPVSAMQDLSGKALTDAAGVC